MDQVVIVQLEQFFAGITIPKVVRINRAITQTDAPKFVKETIDLLKAGSMAPFIARLAYERLVELKGAILEPVK